MHNTRRNRPVRPVSILAATWFAAPCVFFFFGVFFGVVLFLFVVCSNSIHVLSFSCNTAVNCSLTLSKLYPGARYGLLSCSRRH